MRNSERGASQVPLVICIVLLLGATGWAWHEHGERESLKNQLNDIRAAGKPDGSANVSDARIKELIRAGLTGPKEALRLEDLSKVLGYIKEDEGGAMGPNAEKANEGLTKFLQAVDTGEIAITIPTEQYVDGGPEGIKATKSEDGYKVSYTGRAELRGQDPTFEAVFDRVILPGMRRMVADIKRYAALAAQFKQQAATAEAQHKADLAAKDAVISQKGSEYASLDAEKNRMVSELKRERDDAQAARAAAETAAEQAKTESDARLRDSSRIAQQKSEEVRVLKERERALVTDTSPDGTITAVGNSQSTIIVDLGKSDNLIPGTTFDVYGYAKSGREVYKGAIKVTMVGEETSQAAILDLADSLSPVIAGDRVRSLTYNPRKIMNFALAGRFQQMGRSDAAQRLKALGANVDEKVNLNTDYLVIGAPESEDAPIEETEAYKAAKMLGVTIITERELSRFTRY
jgi:hypothetical protein